MGGVFWIRPVLQQHYPQHVEKSHQGAVCSSPSHEGGLWCLPICRNFEANKPSSFLTYCWSDRTTSVGYI